MKRHFIRTLLVLSLIAMPLVVSVRDARAGEERREHPRISHAITALQAAIAELQAAPHDFGGHRVEAVQACQGALNQLHLALAYRAGVDSPR